MASAANLASILGLNTGRVAPERRLSPEEQVVKRNYTALPAILPVFWYTLESLFRTQEETMKSMTDNVKRQDVSKEALYNSIVQWRDTFFTNFRSPETEHLPLEAFEFDINEAMGIPKNALLEMSSGSSDRIVPVFLYALMNYSEGRRLLYQSAPQIWNLFFLFGKAPYTGKQMFNAPSTKENYKIHLTPKSDYLLYCICKLSLLYNPAYGDTSPFDPYTLQTKVVLHTRTQNLLPTNDALRSDDINGGVMPGIVIYAPDDPVRTKMLLERILALFPEHAEIGHMSLTGDETLPPFNVRINRLVCYAHGDRSTKLDARIADRKAGRASARYTTPRWLDTMLSSCSADTRDELNAKTQLFLGQDICAEDGTAIPLDEPCYKDMCYLTHEKAAMLDPQTIGGGGAKGGGRARRKTHSRRRKSRKIQTRKSRRVKSRK